MIYSIKKLCLVKKSTDTLQMTLTPPPYWTMSRLVLARVGRFDYLYSHPPPNYSRRYGRRRRQPESKSPPPPIEPGEPVTYVGCRMSEYQAAPRREPLPARPPPPDVANPTADNQFVDLHTPIQITKKFGGDVPLSVRIETFTAPGSSHSSTVTPPRRKVKSRDGGSRVQQPIHDVLFEESILEVREDIDPWGISGNENVVAPDKVYRGVPLTVSRLRPAKR
jgi:hypothetical protein